MEGKKINFKKEFSPRDEFARLQNEFNNETPRSVAIVGCAYIDDLLNKLLKAVLIEDKKLFKDFIDRLTFERRIIICYLLGLIDRNMMDDLKIISKIRNKFAHDKNLNSFNVEIISTECKKLKYILEVKWVDIDVFNTPRKKYQAAIAYYFGRFEECGNFCKRIDKKTLFNVPK